MLKLFGLFLLVSVAYAAVEIYPHEEKPIGFGGQIGCFNSEMSQVLPYQEYFYPNTACGRYFCLADDGETRHETCGAKAVPEGCQLTVADNSKQYPDCCPQLVCVDVPAVTQPAPSS